MDTESLKTSDDHKSSSAAGKLGSTQKFSTYGRDRPLITRQEFERSTRLTSVLRRGYLGSDGMVPTYSQVGAYFINPPHFSNEVGKLLFRQIRDRISDANSEQQKWFFELYPQLMLIEGLNTFDVDAPADALTQFIMVYIRDVVDTLAAYATAAVWVNLDGHDEFSSRITSRLKPSAMRTFAARLGTLPIPKSLKDYVLNATRILRHDSSDDTISVYLPVWRNSEFNHKSPNVARYKGSDYTLATPNIAYDFGHEMLAIHEFGNRAMSDFTAALGAGDIRSYLGLPSTGASKDGYIADSIYATVEYQTNLMVRKYRSTMKSADSQMARFVTQDLGVVDDVFTWDELVSRVTGNEVGDAQDFAKQHMQYYDLPGPVPHPLLPNRFGGVIDPFLDEDGVPSSSFRYDPSSYRETITETADNWMVDETANPNADQRATNWMRLGSELGLYTSDPAELDKLRHFAQTGSGLPWRPADVPALPQAEWPFGKDITFDWSKWSWTAEIENWGAMADQTAEAVETLPILGHHSIALATGAIFEGESRLKNKLSHVGEIPAIVNFLKLFSSQMVYYTGKPGQTAADIIALTGDKGHWAINVEEVERGILRPYWVVSPLVNNRDFQQCGFYNVVTQEEVLASTADHQVNRWSWFAAKGLQPSSAVPFSIAITNPFYDDNRRNILKDGLIFIGDSLGLTPESHFTREDTMYAYEFGSPQTGMWYPVKPFVNRLVTNPRFPRSASPYNAFRPGHPTLKTPQVPPANSLFVLGELNLSSYDANPLHFTYLAWKNWLPDLSYDEDHPYPETLFGYVEEGEARMNEFMSGGDFLSVLNRLAVTPLASFPIDPAIKRILKIEAKIDRKELPQPYSRKSFGKPSGKQGGRKGPAKSDKFDASKSPGKGSSKPRYGDDSKANSFKDPKEGDDMSPTSGVKKEGFKFKGKKASFGKDSERSDLKKLDGE